MRLFAIGFGLLAVLGAAIVALPVLAFAQDTAGIVQNLCANDGALLDWLVGVLGTIVGAKVVMIFTNAPPPDSKLYPFYAVLRFAALAICRAIPATAAAAQQAKALVALFVPMLLLLGLAACADDAAIGKLQTDVAMAQKVVAIIQPLASDAACAAQAGANASATVGELLGEPDVVAGASLASKGAGLFCNGLPAGAIVMVPADQVPPSAQIVPPDAQPSTPAS